MEHWKLFKETEIRNYFVSTAGRIKYVDKTTNKEHVFKPSVSPDGRKTVKIEDEPRQYVYRIVAETFIPNLENKPTVNHIRGLDAGDGVDNLEWMTHAEQEKHARETGLKTSGFTPTVVLNTNGDVIAKHDTMREALTSYDGKSVYYNKDVKFIGNVILMKQSYYDTLYKGEPNEDLFTDDGELKDDLSAIVNDCFEHITKYFYVVNGQLIDNSVTAGDVIGRDKSLICLRTKKELVADINGHEVSRFKNLIGVGDLS